MANFQKIRKKSKNQDDRRSPRHPLFVSRSRLHSAARVIVRCVDVFEGHPASPDTTVDVVSSAMLIERTSNLPADVDTVYDGRKI